MAICYKVCSSSYGETSNVFGLILAGCADFKTTLSQYDIFDKRLKEKILKVVDVSYGGEHGFNQAIELSCEYLDYVNFIQEKRLLGKYFEQFIITNIS